MEIEEFNPDDLLYQGSGYSAVPDQQSLNENATQKKVQLPQREEFIRALKIAAPAFVGGILIIFGLTTTGSYYATASRFSGFLASIWYGWQLGNFLAMIGSVLIYDSIKRSGYL